MIKTFTSLIFLLSVSLLYNCSTQKRFRNTPSKLQSIDLKSIDFTFNKNYLLLGYYNCNNLNVRVESTMDKYDFKYFMIMKNPAEITFFSSQKFHLNSNPNAILFYKKGKYFIERLPTERKLFGLDYPRNNTVYEINFNSNEIVLRDLDTKEYCLKYELIKL